MKKVLVVLIMAISIFGLVACTKNTSSIYEITIQNQSNWNEAAIVEFYDMSGTLKATADIKNDKANASLEDGNYIVQIKDAPESVDYNIVVLTSSNKNRTVTLKNSERSEREQTFGMFEFFCGAIVLDNGVPQQGRMVLMCENIEGGICLLPEYTDKNGLAQIKVSAMEYHVQILNDESDTLMEETRTIMPSKRFYIMDLAKKSK